MLPSFLRAARPLASAVPQLPERHAASADALTVETHASIDRLDAGLWDALVGDLSYIDARSMRAAERVFHGGGGPVVAWAATRPAGREYRALYCGVDYDDFRAGKTNPYRQLLWQQVRRAGRLSCERLHLGMGAGQEKTRFGAAPSPALALVRADDACAATRLQEFVTQTALRSAGRS